MNKRGFTLLELLIVIVILGVLAALITGNFFTSLKKGRDTKRKADLEQVSRALELYYEDKKVYPATLTFGGKLCETASCLVAEKVYMQKVPNDPISEMSYEYKLTNGSYRLYACLENNLQILPYDVLTQAPTMSCSSVRCKEKDGTTDTDCVWAVSSSDVSP
ncbi:MAG: prepilin-type N-terminal cleavage/methylation domain-containing protein [Patescibacteria group bacterium]|jgi:type II secretion system protein G